MKKPAFSRKKNESLGMTAFNHTRNLYSLHLNVEKQHDPMFELCPHLLQFKRQKRDKKLMDMMSNVNDIGPSKPVNFAYKDKSGNTYGLYNRFYWD